MEQTYGIADKLLRGRRIEGAPVRNSGFDQGTPTSAAGHGGALEVVPLPAFDDNYLWLLHNGRDALVVDPGDAAVVQRGLDERGLRLSAILVTHHHADHVGGVLALKAAFDVPVYGPRAEAQRIGGLTRLVDEPDTVFIETLGLQLSVLAVPGHTLGHIAYYSARHAWLFCGDTLFASGCGRLFEGTPGQMYASLQKFAQLPPQTAVFCAHEYTLSNLAFARAVEPGNVAIQDETERVKSLRAAGRPSVPSTIRRELALNPFLRCDQAEAVQQACVHAQQNLSGPVAVFTELRRWKDGFRAELRV